MKKTTGKYTPTKKVLKPALHTWSPEGIADYIAGEAKPKPKQPLKPAPAPRDRRERGAACDWNYQASTDTILASSPTVATLRPVERGALLLAAEAEIAELRKQLLAMELRALNAERISELYAPAERRPFAWVKELWGATK
jgi:hypothetical protein